jgi:hypothetical protein
MLRYLSTFDVRNTSLSGAVPEIAGYLDLGCYLNASCFDVADSPSCSRPVNVRNVTPTDNYTYPGGCYCDAQCVTVAPTIAPTPSPTPSPPVDDTLPLRIVQSSASRANATSPTAAIVGGIVGGVLAVAAVVVIAVVCAARRRKTRNTPDADTMFHSTVGKCVCACACAVVDSLVQRVVARRSRLHTWRRRYHSRASTRLAAV